MLNGLDILNEIRVPLKELMDNFAEAVAERVVAKLKVEEADTEILHAKGTVRNAARDHADRN